MADFKTIQDVYDELDTLVPQLKQDGQEKLANRIHHRMHKVAWTSGIELVRELQAVLTTPLQSDSEGYKPETKEQLHLILKVFDQSK